MVLVEYVNIGSKAHGGGVSQNETFSKGNQLADIIVEIPCMRHRTIHISSYSEMSIQG